MKVADWFNKIADLPPIIISKNPQGLLTEDEIVEILAILKEARADGSVPPISYEYRHSTAAERLLGGGGELLYLRPKEEGTLLEVARATRATLSHTFGNKYKVSVETIKTPEHTKRVGKAMYKGAKKARKTHRKEQRPSTTVSRMR